MEERLPEPIQNTRRRKSKKRIVVTADVRPWTAEEQADLKELYELIERQRNHAAAQLQEARRRQVGRQVARELLLLAELATRQAAATRIQSGARAGMVRRIVQLALRAAHDEHNGAASQIQHAIRKRLGSRGACLPACACLEPPAQSNARTEQRPRRSLRSQRRAASVHGGAGSFEAAHHLRGEVPAPYRAPRDDGRVDRWRSGTGACALLVERRLSL